MRLINTTTLRIADFYGENIPPYAILSHTWAVDEPTYQGWANWTGKTWPSNNEDSFDRVMRSKKGCEKILRAAQLASAVCLDWLWADTVCIDKTSSAELTEAINSMYNWYRDSVVCLAFLDDIPAMSEDHPEFEARISGSRWFTRGWTLQELIAPRQLDFYSQTWTRLGSKSEGRLLTIASVTTGIDEPYLTGEGDLLEVSVSKKMSWLSKRTTTRLEDMAYCMLGIFDVNMPLMYGEGKKAFTRLQEEIIRFCYDHTIFCWTWDENVPANWVSMLSPWPSTFQNSGKYVHRDLEKASSSYTDQKWSPYSITNLGLSISLRLLPNYISNFAVLDVGVGDESSDAVACVPVRHTNDRAIKAPFYCRLAYPSQPIILPQCDIASLYEKDIFMQTKPKMYEFPPDLQQASAAGPYLYFGSRDDFRFLDTSNVFAALPDIITHP